MKRHLVFVGCLLVAQVSPSQAHNRGARKTAQKAVVVPPAGTGLVYRKGQGPEEAVYKAVKSHPAAAQFKIVWGYQAFSASTSGAAVYDRAKKTLRTYDESSDNGRVERSGFIYTKVDDAALLRVVQYLSNLPSHPGFGCFSGFFSDLEKLGYKKRTLARYKHYYRSYTH